MFLKAKKEGKLIVNSINTLKEDIKNIKDENLKICEKIRLLEEDVEESDSEESLCDEGEELSKKYWQGNNSDTV